MYDRLHLVPVIRNLYCRKCGDGWGVNAKDREMGFDGRTKYLSSRKPACHGISINGHFEPLADLHCDGCNEVITGLVVVAVTMWNTHREGEPGNWEKDFGTELTPEAAQTVKQLEKQ